jgi:hypothetical protein
MLSRCLAAQQLMVRCSLIAETDIGIRQQIISSVHQIKIQLNSAYTGYISHPRYL